MPPNDRWKARRRALMLVTLTLWAGVSGLLHTVMVAAPERPGEVPWDVRLAARNVEHLVLTRAPAHATWHPEGELFVFTFAGLALHDLAETTGDADDVARALRVARAVLPRIDALLMHRPFSRMAKWKLRGGICWFAGQNLLRARLIALAGAGATPEEVRRFHADSALLHRAFLDSATGVLEAHPGATWPVDSLFGHASLTLHDRLYGTRYSASFARFRQSMERARHAPTGLMPSFLHLDGRARDLPRGVALSWSAAVLPALDADFARAQWRAYRESFFGCAVGLCLVREYPRGVGRHPKDVFNTGPIIRGWGMSATAFALAGARASGDVETAAALRRLGTLVGLPTVTPYGLRYWGGAVDLFQVLALWTRTVPLAGTRSSGVAWGLGALVAAGWGLFTWPLARAMRRALLALREAPPGGSRWQALLCGLAGAALAAHLAVPALPLPVLLLMWAGLELLGRWTEQRAGHPEVEHPARAHAPR